MEDRFKDFAQSDPAYFFKRFFELRTLMPKTLSYITSIGPIDTEVNMDGIDGWIRVGEDLQRPAHEERKDGAEIKSGSHSCATASNNWSKIKNQDRVDPNDKAFCSNGTISDTILFNPNNLETYLQRKTLSADEPIECSFQPKKKYRKKKPV